MASAPLEYLVRKRGSDVAPDVLPPIWQGDSRELSRAWIRLVAEDHTSGGAIYKGECRGTQVTVQVSKRRKWSQAELDALRSETAVLHKMKHPNLALFFGIATDEEVTMASVGTSVWLVSEYVCGGPLRRWIYRNNQGEDAQAVNVIKLRMANDLCLVMSWLHANNIIHGNITSQNLLLDESLHIKISDYGLSDFLQREVYTTQDSQWRRQFQYTAPEILQGGPKTKESDVFSCCLLYTSRRG